MRLRQRDDDIIRLNEECSSAKGGQQGKIRILSDKHISASIFFQSIQITSLALILIE